MNRSDVPSMVSQILGRPVRWAPEGSFVACYDGHERTLQVFNVNVTDQIKQLELLEPYRCLLEQAAGGPLVIMSFSVQQSLRHADFVGSFETE